MEGGPELAFGRFISIADRVYLRFSNIESLSLLPAFQIDFAARPREDGTPSDNTTVSSSSADGGRPLLSAEPVSTVAICYFPNNYYNIDTVIYLTAIIGARSGSGSVALTGEKPK